MKKSSVLVIYDNFLIGGIQRLILDQCYEMNVLGHKNELLILDMRPNVSVPTFEIREQSLIKKYGVKITFIPGSKFAQFVSIFKLIKNNSFDNVFAHSLRGGIFVWISRFILRKKIYITTIIHQLPSLSAPSQRRRRYFYSRFSDELLIFSEPARKDWNHYLQKSLVMRVIFGSKQINTCRNGVFLPRVSINSNIVPQNTKYSGRLVFIGRLKAWKGLDTFLQIVQSNRLKDYEVLIVTPTDPVDFIEKLDNDFQKRITCIVGKSISEIDFTSSDIHLYPANYGPDSLFTEGVSINVLEMACLGIPSLVTSGGTQTWPELVKLGLLVEVDWGNLESVVETITSGVSLSNFAAIDSARQIIDIRNNISQLIYKK